MSSLFLSALEIGWLKRILCYNGKITKVLQKMRPSIQNKTEKNVAGICKCMANVFLLHLMILHQNVYFTTLIYAKEKHSFFSFINKCVDCGFVSTGQLLGPNGYLTYKEFKTKFQTVQ